MLESKFQTLFNHWLKTTELYGAFELKVTHENSIPFSDVKEHQEQALWNSKHTHCIYKIPDDSRGQKPFDCFKLTGSPSYVVILFHSTKTFFVIDIDVWLKEKKGSKRKSLTVERAESIGIKQSLRNKQ